MSSKEPVPRLSSWSSSTANLPQLCEWGVRPPPVRHPARPRSLSGTSPGQITLAHAPLSYRKEAIDKADKYYFEDVPKGYALVDELVHTMNTHHAAAGSVYEAVDAAYDKAKVACNELPFVFAEAATAIMEGQATRGGPAAGPG